MPKGYRHLTHTGRCQIHALMKSGLSGGAIARNRYTHVAFGGSWVEVRQHAAIRAATGSI